MPLNEQRAPEPQVVRPAPTREINHLPKQAIGSHSTATDRAMLRLCGVLRRIVEQNHEEMERAA